MFEFSIFNCFIYCVKGGTSNLSFHFYYRMQVWHSSWFNNCCSFSMWCVFSTISVSPEVCIQREGTNLSGTHYVDKGTELQLACIVFRAKEEPVIEWKIENTPLRGGGEEMVNSSNRFIDGTFDFKIALTHVIKHDTNIVCSSYSDYNRSVSVIISTAKFHYRGVYTMTPFHFYVVIIFVIHMKIVMKGSL